MGIESERTSRRVDGGAARRPAGKSRRKRPGDITAWLENSVSAIQEELREPDAAAPSARRLAPPAYRLRPPAPLDGPTAVGEPAVTPDAIAPLVAEVVRLRVEVARMRRKESESAPVSPPGRAELLQLLAGIMVSIILVAIALVIVLKA